ncbi:PEP-CTERM sorting domain-containing protein [Aquincola tertiaricarbonis]|uniref:PEP-CTERM sorting domain-containing protein n=1 Tax=Aquincola tertiaricarbonis TaxID=391953 RepID=UPI0006153339|nr:PEP-CTERM sorting domain-containing protein [Aquincola tertiaricarbonis]
MSFRAAAVLTLAAASLFAEAEAASLTGNASFGPLSIELVDLDPTDGIAPSIDFSATNYTAAYTGAMIDFIPDYSEQFSETGRWQPSSVQLSANGVTGTANIASSGTAAGTTATAGATLNSPTSSGGFTFLADLGYVGFTLSARTRAVFTSAASLETTGSLAVPGEDLDVLAFVDLSLYRVVEGAWLGVGQDRIETFQFTSISRSLTATFENSGATDQTGIMRGISYVGGGYTAPVPEPAPAGLLLAGLTVMAAVARCRRPSH